MKINFEDLEFSVMQINEADFVATNMAKEWGINKDSFANMKSQLIKKVHIDELPITYVCKHNGKIIASASLYRCDSVTRQDLTPWIANVYVELDYRKLGIAKALQDMVVNKAKELGYKQIFLWTGLNGYYEKYGWDYIEDIYLERGGTARLYRLFL